jgi:hypothetical protein
MTKSNLLLTILLPGGLCIRAQTYTITELIADDLGSFGYAINNSGQVAGAVAQEPGAVAHNPFLWSPATGKQELPSLPGFNRGEAYGNNEAEHVMGCSWLCQKGGCLESRAFLYRDGSTIDLSAGYYSCAKAVNSVDQVVGYTGGAAFFWNGRGVTTIAPDGSQSNHFSESEARGINDASQVAGTWLDILSSERDKSPFPPCHLIDVAYSFRWTGASSQTLTQLNATAYAINNSGTVAGIFLAGNRNRAFIWSGIADVVEISPLDGHNSNSALGINHWGDVVGGPSTVKIADASMRGHTYIGMVSFET